MATLGFAMLELLARQPMTGYDIAQRMRHPIGYMWTASHSQIYGELATLERERLARAKVIAGPGPRDTKLYSITAAGRRALRAWVTSPLPAARARNELFLRVRALWLASPPERRALLEPVLAEHRALLAEYRREARGFDAGRRSDPGDPQFGQWATLQAGLAAERAMVRWCEWLLAELRNAE